jgi:Uncharacterized protein conserved in bacteria C-term(DUF2220).
MTPLTEKLLKKCAELCDNESGYRAMTIPIDLKRFGFYHRARASIRAACNEELQVLSYSTGGFGILLHPLDQDCLERITVSDPVAVFSNHLGWSSRILSIKQVLIEIQTILSTAPDWLINALSELKTLWTSGKTCHGFSWQQSENLATAIQFVSWADQVNGEYDYRTASSLALSNSKTLERKLASITRLARLKMPDAWQDRPDDYVLGQFGVHKYPPLLHLSGHCQVVTTGGELSLISPYAAFPVDAILQVKLLKSCRYILSIENRASFERYCREVRDDCVVLYSNGFPSSHWLKMVNEFICGHGDTPVYHWGDIDVGGYRILSYINQGLECDVIPLNMIPNAADEKTGIPASECLAALSTSGYLRQSDIYRQLRLMKYVLPEEQENSSPSTISCLVLK